MACSFADLRPSPDGFDGIGVRDRAFPSAIDLKPQQEIHQEKHQRRTSNDDLHGGGFLRSASISKSRTGWKQGGKIGDKVQVIILSTTEMVTNTMLPLRTDVSYTTQGDGASLYFTAPEIRRRDYWHNDRRLDEIGVRPTAPRRRHDQHGSLRLL